MQIHSINFGNKIISFDEMRAQKGAPTTKQTKPQGDTFTKTKAPIIGTISDIGYTKDIPMPKDISEGVQYFRATAPAVDDPTDAIFYSSQFKLLSELMVADDECKITPDEAAKEFIRLLRTGKPTEAISKAMYEEEDCYKADAFFAAYYQLVQKLSKDVHGPNLMATIEILADPIESMSEEYIEELEDNEDENDDDFADIDDVFYLQNMINIQEGKSTPEETQAFMKNVDTTFRDIMCMPEYPKVDVGFDFGPNFNPEKVKKAFGFLVDKLAETQRLFIEGVIKPPVIEAPQGDTFTPSDKPEPEE